MTLLVVFASFFAALITSFLVIKYGHLHKKFSFDHDFLGIQKFHTESTPRIGGIPIFFGLAVGCVLMNNDTIEPFWILISTLPILLIGLAEDLTKSIPPFIRLIASFFSASIAIYYLNISLLTIGWPWFDDNILSIQFFSIILTMFMIAGVSHSTNIIDGFNGLLLGYSEIVLLILLWVSIQTGDSLVFSIVLTTMGTIAGVLLFNFPKAKIFTGDGGAYMIGGLLSITCLLLVKRNSNVSPWFALLIMSYPVFETFFSIYRKKFLRNMSPSIPDGIHLHMLKYKRVIPLLTGKTKRDDIRNSLTSVLVWIFVIPFMLPALLWWDDHLIMISTIILFCVCYIWIYFSIVRFKFGLGGKKR